MIIAVIPARGGSKRIPGKNTRPFCGKPLIQYSIEAALQSQVFDRVIVSTDSEDISNLAIKLGAEVPFLRPAEISDCHTPTVPVIRHAVENLEISGGTVSYCCCLYATAPFVSADDIRRGLNRLQGDPDAHFAFPVTTFAASIFRSLRLVDDRVEMHYPENEMARSQDLPQAYHDAGQFYWGTAAAWKSDPGIFTSPSIGIPIPRQYVQDIDTPEDWLAAEAMFRARCFSDA